MKIVPALAVAACLAAPWSASAFTLVDVPTDAALTALLGGAGEPNLSFVAEGRIGDGGGPATHELNIGISTGAPADTDQFAWASNQPIGFRLAYDGTTRQAEFAFGSGTPSVAFIVPSGPRASFTDMFFRARSSLTSSVLLSELALDGVAFGQNVSASGGGLDFLRVADGALDDGFTLTGRATFAWTGTAPTNSNLAFQIKLGDAPPIPEPSTYALMLAGLAALGFAARRRRAAV